MRLLQDELRLSASDLANHLGCRHLTQLNLAAARGQLVPPVWRDPILEVLQQRGFEHEANYLNHLRYMGLSVVDASSHTVGTAFSATIAAMRGGADIIVQPTLVHDRWFGRADVLMRVPQDGAWSYEVVDTKLARNTRAGTILQLCLYSDIIAGVQGISPEYMHVVSPGTGFERETFRVDDHLAYYRFVKQRLRRAVDVAQPPPETYPEPVAQCDICRWWARCDQRRRADDHMSLVAGISTSQRRELLEWGVGTLADLATLPLPIERRPRRGARASYVQIREQARVQLEARDTGRPVYELLPHQPERGLARLPAPSRGDIFFDIEGDAFVGTGGLEYLLGWVTLGPDGAATYDALWAVAEQEERASFEAFIDEVMRRLAIDPDLHIYHFAPYEPGAIKRLMGRYDTREAEVDQLLRAGVFVDLYSITRQAVRAGIERYSIKDLEQFYGYEREVELREASASLRAFERALELGQVDVVPEGIRETVEVYNRDDCASTLHLRNWLEELRAELLAGGEDIPRPTLPEATERELDDHQIRVQALMDALLSGLPMDLADRSRDEQGRWLMAHLLGWHRREEKAPWWEYFRLAELDEEDLLHENAAVGGLEFLERDGGTDKCPVHRYRFPSQETSIQVGDPLHRLGGGAMGSVAAIDNRTRLLDIKKRADCAELHSPAVFTHKVVNAPEQAKSLFRLAEWIRDHGVDAPGDRRAARDLLLALPPRLKTSKPSRQPLQLAEEATLKAARRLALDLDGGVLALQGPPGAGKTYTGARMICELVRAGRTVGVTAASHKVIRNLLEGVVDAAKEEGLQLRCIQKVSGKAAKDTGQPILETTKNIAVADALMRGDAQVAAGTAWLWSRADLEDLVDVLFVDEAGQISLANALAVAQAAKNLVLLGDPQQLDQPLQGTHPEGADRSALEHLLEDRHTIPANRGLFLGETWRLHPDICEFTSELFYESRLSPRPDLATQRLTGPSQFQGSGLWFVPVEHHGNQNSSFEEAAVVRDLFNELLATGVEWVDRDGVHRQMRTDDVLIVAPYNAQVGAIGELLPQARVGTVDKFQGQEAPVVIYSMATSTPDEAPRGMEFLYSLNRLNVASSRARCACILVASPTLFEAECKTPRQIQLANAFCRYLELAQTTSVGASPGVPES